MKLKITCFIVLFLMVSFNLLNTDNLSFAQSLEDEETPKEVIVSLNSTNIPGFQEGSIFTDTTLSSGDTHTCAILDDGSVSCWGRNDDGQLGDGTTTDKNTSTQTLSLGTGRTAVAISSGWSHNCAILDDGTVSCWGWNIYGQLGDGTTTDRNTPTQTSTLGTGRTAVAISSGGAHTCAILDDGSVSCWGYNNKGQLGDGTTTNRNTSTQTSSLGTGRTAVAISSGGYHTCAVLDDASVSCWGLNGDGQLGDGTATDRSTPTQTSSLGVGRTAVAISSRLWHTCAILDDGTVSCWGWNIYGQLGDGTNTNRNTPTQTSSLGTGRTAVAISSGDTHTCAILDDATVSCWGGNAYGGLGDGTTTLRTTPTQTSSLGTGRTAVAISSGNAHTCAILDDASVSCWGDNWKGQLGDGTTTDRNRPTQTSSLGTAANPRTAALSERDFDGDGVLNIFDVHQNLAYSEITISSGVRHTCAILDDGSVSCWGRNSYGQLGDGTTTQRNTPTQTSSLGTGITAVAISSGEDHTCAILDDGSVSCWGANDAGGLGDGTTTNRNTPTQTSSLGTNRTAVAISSGRYHTCAILDDASVSCWGYNYYGQLGDGTNTDQSTPTQTSSLGTNRTAVAISSGDYHTCAILDDGTVSCWGKNGGRLGDGTTTNRNTPTQTSSLGTGRTAVAISAGWWHTCALLDDGSVSCWGYNSNGQLGDGTTTDRNTPTQTSNLGTNLTAVAISSGYKHTCAILDNASVSCWGWNDYGQLGDGTTTDRNTPTQTSNLGTNLTAVAISSRAFHTCAILDNASVSCWGWNYYGQLGDGTTTQKYTPTQTSTLGTTANPRTALLVDGDTDGDGTLDHFDDFPNNSVRSTACISGQYGRYVCVDAPAGKYVPSSSAMYATDCSAGTYQELTGQTSCDDADAGYYVPITSQTNQTDCAIGTYQANTGQSSCDDADAGYYVATTAQSSQIPCAMGTYQALTGQASCDDADAGFYVDQMAQTNQSECAIGTYQSLTGQASCIYADAGYYVSSTAQISQIPCSAGTYNPNTGSISSSACGDADAGYYVSTIAQSSQTACLAGNYQSLTGQTSCDDADAGYYVSTIAQISQTACATGTYQANTGQSSCDDADAGYYVPTIAQISQTPCPIGTYQALTGQSSCDDADAGYYVSTIAQTSQITCAIGTYQALTGQSSCDDADAGYYVSTIAQSSQTACAIGTYQALPGQSSCEDADRGHYVGQSGQLSQIECLAGTYQPDVGQSSCISASINFYVPLDGAIEQTACPNQTSTIEIGSKLESDCVSDADSDLLPAEAKQTRTILIAAVILLVTASIVGALVVISRKEDTESVWHQEDHLFD